MSAAFDIQPKIKAILEANDLVKVRLRPDKRRTFDARQNNGLLEGNVPSGTTLKGEQTLLVQGAILGTSNAPCNISMKDDVIVTGDTAHAHIRGCNIYLVRNLQHSRLNASGNIKIGTNVISSKLTVGDFEVRRHQINELNHDLHLAKEKHAALQRQVEIEGRRMNKACTITHTPLNFNVGHIVQQKYGRVRIDLKNFYQSFNGRSGEKINQVLREFFAKGIVGVLARANRKYLLNNPAREKIFLELLRKLRELFFLVHDYETLNKRISRDAQTIYQLLKELNERNRTIYIQGSLEPDSELIFILPDAVCPVDGTADFKYQSVHLKVGTGTDEKHLHLEIQNARGEKSSQNLSRAEFKNLSFQIYEGTIVWNPLEATQPRAAV